MDADRDHHTTFAEFATLVALVGLIAWLMIPASA
jgi:hypothetical protein